LKKRIELEKLRALQPKIHTWSSFYEANIPSGDPEPKKVYLPLNKDITGKRRLRDKYF
jgi:large subunit ribosomal protein L3